MSNQLVAKTNLSNALTNSRNSNERLNDLLRDVRNLRIQLSGDFPTPNEDKVKERAIPGIVGAILDQQESNDSLIEEIFRHVDSIHDALGSFYHPNAESDDKDSA